MHGVHEQRTIIFVTREASYTQGQTNAKVVINSFSQSNNSTLSLQHHILTSDTGMKAVDGVAF